MDATFHNLHHQLFRVLHLIILQPTRISNSHLDSHLAHQQASTPRPRTLLPSPRTARPSRRSRLTSRPSRPLSPVPRAPSSRPSSPTLPSAALTEPRASTSSFPRARARLTPSPSEFPFPHHNQPQRLPSAAQPAHTAHRLGKSSRDGSDHCARRIMSLHERAADQRSQHAIRSPHSRISVRWNTALRRVATRHRCRLVVDSVQARSGWLAGPRPARWLGLACLDCASPI